MKIFIWKVIKDLTENYHSEGGLVVIAENLDEAYELEPKSKGIKPDFEAEILTDGSKKFVFPDAGCC